MTPKIRCKSSQFPDDYVDIDCCLSECLMPCKRFMTLEGFSDEDKTIIDIYIAAHNAALIDTKKHKEARYAHWQSSRSRRK